MLYKSNFPDVLILYLINRFDIVPGKKAFQKLMYFINLEINKYKFKWDRFGPFSEELSYLLDDLVFENYVSIHQQSLLVRPGWQYNLYLSERGQKYLETTKISRKEKNIIDHVIELLRTKTPRDMELLASIHYIVSWAKLANRKLSDESIYKFICQLKPDSGFSVEEVREATRYLEKCKLI